MFFTKPAFESLDLRLDMLMDGRLPDSRRNKQAVLSGTSYFRFVDCSYCLSSLFVALLIHAA